MRAGQNCQTVEWISFPALCLIFIRRIFSISSKVHARFSKRRDFCAAWSSPILFYSAAQFSPVQSLSRVWLCNPMNRSIAGLPVHRQLLEFTQTHIHRVGDAIQPSHPLSSPSPPAPNPSQHQGFFQWVNSSNEVAKVLKFQLQHQSFQWTPRIDLL